MKSISTVLALAALSVPAIAGPSPAQSEMLRGEVEPGRATPALFDHVQYSSERDGSTWASGNTYKARFGADGATYIPFLGSRAPRNHPLAMSLARATVNGVEIPLERAGAPVRDGDRIKIERGPIDEVYELALDSVEQTFVVAARPASGDLLFVVHLDSEMTRTESADGFTFSNALGSVHYGRAFVREADGTRVPVVSRAVFGGVEIVVGREYLDRATFPLVVDPVISTFAIDTVTYDALHADVAYDLTTDRYLTVYERAFSAVDGDIYSILREGNGSNSYFAALDISTENWRRPRCANLNSANQFLMVAQASNVLGAPNSNIWGMTVDAVTQVPGWKTLISAGDPTHEHYFPDVGGDPSAGAGTANYCVTWQRNYTSSDTDIHARFVTPSATLVGAAAILIDNSGGTLDSWPSISKSNQRTGNLGAWTIAWHRPFGNESDIHAARILSDGVIPNPSTAVHTAAGEHRYAQVSSPLEDGRTLVLFSRYTTDSDIHYVFLYGTSVDGTGNLSAIGASSVPGYDQFDYSVDSDGQRFAVAYCEQGGSSYADTFISTFAPVGFDIALVERHAPLDTTPEPSYRTEIASCRSGGAIGSTRYCVVWDRTITSTGQKDIYGALYDRPIGGAYETMCYGDGSGIACPCANSGGFQRGCANSQSAIGAALGAVGNSQTGAGDTLAFTVTGVPANVTCTLFQGTANSGGVLFGDGVRCVSGSQIRIRTKSSNAGGSASWPTGAEPDISVTGVISPSGAQRYYQVSYRNSAVYCTSATFNISNGMRVFWSP